MSLIGFALIGAAEYVTPRYMDNIFIERLWRLIKYEVAYLHELTDGFKVGRVIDEWIGF